MHILRAILIFSTSLFSSFCFATDNNEFNVICNIYTEAMNSNMPKDVASNYILNNIIKRVTSGDALLAHKAIMEAMGETRYTLFKQSAEHTLKHSWDCEPMSHMFNMDAD